MLDVFSHIPALTLLGTMLRFNRFATSLDQVSTLAIDLTGTLALFTSVNLTAPGLCQGYAPQEQSSQDEEVEQEC